MNHLQLLVRKIIKEVLDYDEKGLKKGNKSNIQNNPLTATKKFSIGTETYTLSYFLDLYENNIEVSFTDTDGGFKVTNKNEVTTILNNVTYNTKEFFRELNQYAIKNNMKFKIYDIKINPTSKNNNERHINRLETSRGKIFNFYLKKNFNIANVRTDDFGVYYELSKPIKFGYNKIENY